MHALGQALVVVLHMRHVLFYRVECRLRPYLICPAHMYPGERSNSWVRLIVCVRLRKGFKVAKEQEKIQTSRIKLCYFFKRTFKSFTLWGAGFLKMPTIMCLCVSVRMGA